MEARLSDPAKAETAILAGSSHITCFGVPLRTPDGTVALAPVEESNGSFLCLNGPFPRDDAYWAELERLSSSHKLFIHWRGNQHMAEYLFASNPMFDFVLSEQPDLPIAERAVVIPELMMTETFMPSFDGLDTILSKVGRTGPGIVICGTPPPKESVDIIRAALAREPYFGERLAALNMSWETVPITPPLILYKMWRLLQRMMDEIAKRHGVPFAPVPPEALTPKGFLREECWSADVTHANRIYGRLLLASYQHYL